MPDMREQIAAPRAARGTTRAVTVLAVVAVIATLYAGREFFVPLTLGVVLAALLAPVVAWLRRHGVPAAAGAALTVLATLAVIVGGAVALEPPLRGFAAEVPKGLNAARAKLDQLRAPLARIGVHLQAPSTPSPAAVPTPPTPGATAAPSVPAPVPAAPGASASSGGSEGGAPAGLLSAVGRIFGGTTAFIGEFVEVLLLAFFLLAAGTAWLEKLHHAVRSPDTRQSAETAAGEMRAVVARYVGVTVGINIGQGVVVALTMWALGLPSPALWGVLTAVFELVPYLGGFVMVGLLLLTGLSAGGSIGHALLPPVAYLTISTLQNNLVSPALYGRGLRLNPSAILIGVMFWYGLWGVAGALLAVPILAAARVLATHVDALAPVAVFLEE